ncbi:hypothetical protein CS542_04105 [Pedobacter sp. IW39]|nr:hypothetical protein CS542_04105 [Pedobacter sp. IW39]
MNLRLQMQTDSVFFGGKAASESTQNNLWWGCGNHQVATLLNSLVLKEDSTSKGDIVNFVYSYLEQVILQV